MTSEQAQKARWLNRDYEASIDVGCEKWLREQQEHMTLNRPRTTSCLGTEKEYPRHWGMTWRPTSESW